MLTHHEMYTRDDVIKRALVWSRDDLESVMKGLILVSVILQ